MCGSDHGLDRMTEQTLDTFAEDVAEHVTLLVDWKGKRGGGSVCHVGVLLACVGRWSWVNNPKYTALFMPSCTISGYSRHRVLLTEFAGLQGDIVMRANITVLCTLLTARRRAQSKVSLSLPQPSPL